MNPTETQPNPVLGTPAAAGGTPPESNIANTANTAPTAEFNFTQANTAVTNPLATTSASSQPVTASADPQPIQTASGLSITELAERETMAPAPAAPQMSAVAPNAPKSPKTPKPKNPNFDFKNLMKQWTFWGMVGCAVLALIAFIFSLTRLQSESVVTEKASDLQAELDEANALLVKYGTMLGLKVNEFGRPIAGTDDGIEKVGIASPEYVYIGEWGLKIKIPKGLKNVSYSFDNAIVNEDGEQYATAFCVTGVPSSADHIPAYAQFTDTDNMKLGCLTRYTKGESPKDQSKPIYQDDKYDYVYSLARFAASDDETEDQELEAEATKLVQDMLSSENISIF